jgi:hypothetical protein
MPNCGGPAQNSINATQLDRHRANDGSSSEF